MAGMGNMSNKYFASYDVIGVIVWVSLFMYACYFFGELEFVKKNLSVIIVVIIFVSILPGVIEIWRNKRKKPAKN